MISDFEVKGSNEFDFRVLTTHTVYKKELHTVRRDEIADIKTWVIDASQSSSPEQNAIAIGDFNANPSSQTKHFKVLVPDGTDFRVLMYESVAAGELAVRTTVPTKDSSTNPNYFHEPVYDHMLVSHPTGYALPANPMNRAGDHMGVWDFDNDPWWDQHGWTRKDIIKAVSDHRPIWFKMDFDAADNDPDGP